MEERRQENKQMLTDIHTVKGDVKEIISILRGSGERSGLIALVQKHDEHISKHLTFQTFVITTMISSIIVGLFGFLFYKLGIAGGGM